MGDICMSDKERRRLGVIAMVESGDLKLTDAVDISWHLKEREKTEGVYVLRTNMEYSQYAYRYRRCFQVHEI